MDVAAAMLLFAFATVSPDPFAKSIPAGIALPPGHTRAELYFEGFESAVPPPGWSLSSSAPLPHTWHSLVDSSAVHDGLHAALVEWTADEAQDERLTTLAFDLSAVAEAHLTFWWMGNPFWAQNADFTVALSTDGAAWTPAWEMSSIAETGFAWRSADLDVSAYAGGNLMARFRYLGTDGADLLLDGVAIGTDSPPAPLNDDCTGAAPAYVLPPGPFTIVADNTLATSDYPLTSPGSCTGYSHNGRDLVWVVDLSQGDAVTATMTTQGEWDDTLFLITDCANPQGSCVAGDNAIPDGSSLSYTRTSAGTGRYYLIASGYASGSGAFTLTGQIGPGTSVGEMSWGRVKAAYR